ncbi:hypothetical protein EXS73_01565 [Candidatus Pacearchaeota archaeon]|nr:hypothetical protein [Candidatus Pacearchaeota archaeon]
MITEGMIGLEIHCYLKTKEKLFCGCSASRERGLRANTLVCPVCTGQPGEQVAPVVETTPPPAMNSSGNWSGVPFS